MGGRGKLFREGTIKAWELQPPTCQIPSNFKPSCAEVTTLVKTLITHNMDISKNVWCQGNASFFSSSSSHLLFLFCIHPEKRKTQANLSLKWFEPPSGYCIYAALICWVFMWCVFICTHVCVCLCVYVYRDRETETDTTCYHLLNWIVNSIQVLVTSYTRHPMCLVLHIVKLKSLCCLWQCCDNSNNAFLFHCFSFSVSFSPQQSQYNFIKAYIILLRKKLWELQLLTQQTTGCLCREQTAVVWWRASRTCIPWDPPDLSVTSRDLPPIHCWLDQMWNRAFTFLISETSKKCNRQPPPKKTLHILQSQFHKERHLI